MRIKPSILLLSLGILFALALSGVIRLMRAASPRITVALKGTREPRTLDFGLVCTIKNRSFRPLLYSIRAAYDTEPVYLRWPWPELPDQFARAGRVESRDSKSFLLPPLPARTNVLIAIVMDYGYARPKIFGKLAQTTLWIRFWHGLLKRPFPPGDSSWVEGGSVQEEFVLKGNSLVQLPRSIAERDTNTNSGMPPPLPENLSPFSRGSR